MLDILAKLIVLAFAGTLLLVALIANPASAVLTAFSLALIWLMFRPRPVHPSDGMRRRYVG